MTGNPAFPALRAPSASFIEKASVDGRIVEREMCA